MATDSLPWAEPEPIGQTRDRRSDPEADHVHPGVDFRDLQYFVAVAEELHFGRAAARLYMTQPGLSQAVARLEQELDVPLLRRTRRNVELTQAGRELLRRARRLLAAHWDVVTSVRKVGRGEAGVVRTGVALLAAPAVAGALKAFQQQHDSIVLDRSVMVSERLLAELGEGRLDVAIAHAVPGLGTAQAVQSEPLRRGRLAILLSPSNSLARRRVVALEELRGETFLVNPRLVAPGAFDGLALMCREFGGFDVKVLESPVASTLALDGDWRLIQEGAAIAAMPEVTARAICPEDVAIVPVQPPPRYVVAMAWRGDEHGAAVRRFLEELRAYRDKHGWIAGGVLGAGRPEPIDLGAELGWVRADNEEEAQRLLPL